MVNIHLAVMNNDNFPVQSGFHIYFKEYRVFISTTDATNDFKFDSAFEGYMV